MEERKRSWSGGDKLGVQGREEPVWGAVLFTCARREGLVGMARVQSRGALHG